MTMRFLALLLLIAGSASAQLFREDASNNRLVMDSGHLQEWDFPVGTLDFEGGTVRPNFVSKNIDAPRDILSISSAPPRTQKDPDLAGRRRSRQQQERRRRHDRPGDRR